MEAQERHRIEINTNTGEGNKRRRDWSDTTTNQKMQSISQKLKEAGLGSFPRVL